MIIRTVDLLLSSILLLLLSPLILILGIAILLDSGLPVIFCQMRIGKSSIPFVIYKFRTMSSDLSSTSNLTSSLNQHRITRVGRILRTYKLDELPQLFNIMNGSMSFVGPRPEVPEYAYLPEFKALLNVRPGLTSLASIVYRDESAILGVQSNPEDFYTSTLLPLKIKIDLPFAQQPTLKQYLRILYLTICALSLSLLPL